jgi:hypothetical protein
MINKLSFTNNDTIEFACFIPDFAAKDLTSATLNIIIENQQKTQQWKFRYPVINGEFEGVLAIAESIKPGRYTFNFALQKGVYALGGKIKDGRVKNELNMMVLQKNQDMLITKLDVDKQKTFQLDNLVFYEDAFLIFSAPKITSNSLYIDLATHLDSTYQPVMITKQVIEIMPANGAPVTDSVNTENTTLPDVEVTAKARTNIERFDEKYSKGVFRNARWILDCLDNDDINYANNINKFIHQQVPALRNRLPESNFMGNIDSAYNQMMRPPVIYYVDEFKHGPLAPDYINVLDVAMIKIYENSTLNPQGLAVAIYSRTGEFEKILYRRYRFSVKGFNFPESTWK